MKILHFVHSYYGFSGATKQAKNLVASLQNLYPELEQRFFTFGESESEREDDFIVYSSPPKLISRCLKFLIIILKFRPDIIHMHGADFALLTIAKLFKVKVYWKTTLYKSDDFAQLTQGKLGFLKKKLIKLIDCNNTLTYQIYNINKKFLPKERLVTIPNGVNIPNEFPKRKEKIVIIVSAIIPRKDVIAGIDFFIKHFTSQEFKLYIIGPASPTLDGYSQQYFSEFQSKLTENIQYLGEQEFSVVSSYLRKATFLIHLSKNEGMPNIVLEAMAYACYPITCDMEGLADELYVNGVSGFNIESDIAPKNLSIIYEPNIAGFNELKKTKSFQIVASKTLNTYIGLKNESK